MRRQPTLNDEGLPPLLAGRHVVLECLGSKEAEDSQKVDVKLACGKLVFNSTLFVSGLEDP